MTDKADVAVIGAGLMGHGIAQVFARAGHRVTIYDPFPASLTNVRDRIAENLTRLGQDTSCVELVTPEPDLAKAVAKVQMITEAAPEKLDLKQDLMRQLEEAAPVDCIIASNTSVIPITDIGAKMIHKARMLGTHWWNPPYLIPLVEVVPTPFTSPEVAERTRSILADAGKAAVLLKKDIPGFVANRMQHALWREAIMLVENGVCDAETVDMCVKNSFGIRLPVLGPLENADLVGLDLTEDIHKVMLPHLDRSTTPAPIVSRLVKEGNLGMKTGQGFYSWTKESADQVRKGLVEYLVKQLVKK